MAGTAEQVVSNSGTVRGDLVNKGFIVSRPDGGASGQGRRTFIVTGLQRSGTTLVAAILRRVGVFMGQEINDLVHEDEAIARILKGGDRDALTRLIGERDAGFGTWGFKTPMLWRSLEPEDLGRFSDPHVIVPFRDSVSVAVRKSLSEFQQAMPALRTALDDQAAMGAFLSRLSCPMLLLSYEKALMFPDDFIEAILQFCDLPRGEALRQGLRGVIEPNRPDYIAQVRLRHEGMIDGLAGGRLCGWCRLTAEADPVALELLVDERVVLSFRADLFRQDLLDAGFGSGHHGFSIDLAGFGLRPHALIRVRVADHGGELQNSGRRLEAYRL